MCRLRRSRACRRDAGGEGSQRPRRVEARRLPRRAVSWGLRARARKGRFVSTTGVTSTTSGNSCSSRRFRRPSPEHQRPAGVVSAAVSLGSRLPAEDVAFRPQAAPAEAPPSSHRALPATELGFQSRDRPPPHLLGTTPMIETEEDSIAARARRTGTVTERRARRGRCAAPSAWPRSCRRRTPDSSRGRSSGRAPDRSTPRCR